MAQGPLPPIPPGNLKIGASHFRRVRDRIEAIKPLAGDGVSLRSTEDGIEISVASSVLDAAGGEGVGSDAQLIELTVCLNGEPSSIFVYGQSVNPLS